MVKYILSKDNQLGNIVELKNSDNDSFKYSLEENETNVTVKILSYKEMEDSFHDIAFLTERIIKKNHPNKIIIQADKNLIQPLQANAYYPKGDIFQHLVDPYRKTITDSVFDEEGYIIDQGSLSNIAFGWFDTAQKGCGWIAAYNLLKMNGVPIQIKTLITDLEKHNFLGKLMGENIFWLVVYLKKKLNHVSVSLPGYSSCMNLLKQCDSGILAYTHSKGAHYASFSKIEDNKVHFYNAVYKKRNHIVNLDDFMKQYSLFHGCIMIGVKKRRWK